MNEYTLDESAYAGYILGSTDKVKLKGKREIVEATRDVLEASRNLYVKLVKEEATFEEVLPLLENKRAQAKKYNKVTGRIWRL